MVSAPNTARDGDKTSGPSGSSGRNAAIGMVWTSAAVIASKLMSFLSQIILGYVLAVESYAVFGIAATAVALVGGFQNSGVSKVLIQKHDQFEKLLPEYSAFGLYFGLLGASILILIGWIFENSYGVAGVFWVIALTSVTVFILPINTIRIAALSIRYRFREINLIEIKRSVIYYLVLIGVALAGAEYFSMAIALVVGTGAHFILLRSATPETRISLKLPFRKFIEIAWTLRLVILTAFLVALAMRADFLVLTKLISIEDLGYYAFGFMLVTSVTIPLSAGINQVFLPVFSRLQSDQEVLHREIPRYSTSVVTLGAALSLVLVGLSAPLIHAIWGGKWDPAIVVIAAVATAMPFRFLSTIAAAGLESYGKWGSRIALLTFDTLLLFLGAIIGGFLFGLPGAAISAALQRAVSGLAGYVVLTRTRRPDPLRLVAFFSRLYAPFVMSAGFLFALDPSRFGLGEDAMSLGWATVESLVGLVLFFLLTAVFNYATLTSLVGFSRKIAKRRTR